MCFPGGRSYQQAPLTVWPKAPSEHVSPCSVTLLHAVHFSGEICCIHTRHYGCGVAKPPSPFCLANPVKRDLLIDRGLYNLYLISGMSLVVASFPLGFLTLLMNKAKLIYTIASNRS